MKKSIFEDNKQSYIYRNDWRLELNAYQAEISWRLGQWDNLKKTVEEVIVSVISKFGNRISRFS